MKPPHVLPLLAMAGCVPDRRRSVVRYCHVGPAVVVVAKRTGEVPTSSVDENVRDVLVAMVAGAPSVPQPAAIANQVAGQRGAGLVEHASEAQWDVHRLDVPANGATSVAARLGFEGERLKAASIEALSQQGIAATP